MFKIGSGTLTVKDAKGKKITITDTSNKTTTQNYGAVSSTSSFWIDDNFIGENNLDAITEDKFAVTELAALKIENLAQEPNYISYSNK